MQAIFLHHLTPKTLNAALLSAPMYERFAPAAKHVIRVIHGLPTLFAAGSLDEIELYVGRTAHDGSRLRGRWRDHRENRAHEFGVVAIACPTDRVRLWEAAANRLVTRLKKRKMLCVANVATGGQGPLPAANVSVIYITWRLCSPEPCRPIPHTEIDGLVEEVRDASLKDLTRDSLRRGMAGLANPSDRERLRWAPGSGV